MRKINKGELKEAHSDYLAQKIRQAQEEAETERRWLWFTKVPQSLFFIRLPAYLLAAWLLYLLICIILLASGLYQYFPVWFFKGTFVDPAHPWKYWNPIGIFG